MTPDALVLELKKVRPYPKEIKEPDKGLLSGTTFFPGGCGLLWESESSPIVYPSSGILVLGKDWGTVGEYDDAFLNGTEADRVLGGKPGRGTWTNLLELFRVAKAPLDRCFFTNCYMGLRREGNAADKYPVTDREFLIRCRHLLQTQIRLFQPNLIVTLGEVPAWEIATMETELSAWTSPRSIKAIDEANAGLTSVHVAGRKVTAVALYHPSNRRPNVKHRIFHFEGQRFEGNDAEVKMLRVALNREQLGPK